MKEVGDRRCLNLLKLSLAIRRTLDYCFGNSVKKLCEQCGLAICRIFLRVLVSNYLTRVGARIVQHYLM